MIATRYPEVHPLLDVPRLHGPEQADGDALQAVRLTPRQAEVFLMLAQDVPMKEIAHRMGLTYSHVRYLVEKGRERLGACTIAAAVWVARAQLVDEYLHIVSPSLDMGC